LTDSWAALTIKSIVPWFHWGAAIPYAPDQYGEIIPQNMINAMGMTSLFLRNLYSITREEHLCSAFATGCKAGYQNVREGAWMIVSIKRGRRIL
jgi:hypothetical protein